MRSTLEDAAEIVVVGGGPGGLCAAIATAECGARVVVLDAYAEPGGQYYHQPPEWVRPSRRQRQGRELWQRAVDAGVEIRCATPVWNLEARPGGPLRLATAGPGGAGELQSQAVILATGAYERPPIFPGWTLPGVITAGAAQALLYQNVRPSQRALVAGTGPLQVIVAANLIRAGVKVAAVLEGTRRLGTALGRARALWGQWQRAAEGFDSLQQILRRSELRLGWGIVAAHGSGQVEGATIARLDADWRPIPGSEQRVECDTLCVGHGLVPFSALARLAGAEMAWRPELGGEIPRRDARMQTSLPGLYAVGDGAGIGGYRLSMLEGRVAGLAAAARFGAAQAVVQRRIRALQPAFEREQAFQRLYAGLFTPGAGIFELAAPDTLVCRCEGVTQARIEQAAAGGATTTAEVKALTRCGMGECQGRMCGQHVMHTLARLTGRLPAQVGLYSARPPVLSLPLGEFIGERV